MYFTMVVGESVPLAVDDHGKYFTPNDIKSPYYTPRPLKCPSCLTGVIPRVSGKIRVAHFAHVSSLKCQGGEGMVHKAAKEMIASSIQKYTFVNTCGSCDGVKRQVFENVECSVETIMGNYIVDVGITDSSGEKYGAIEIHNTHSIGDLKNSYLSRKLSDRVFEVEARSVLNGDLEMHSKLKCSGCNPYKYSVKESKLHVPKTTNVNAIMEDARDRQLFVQRDLIPGKNSVLVGTAGSGKTTLIQDMIKNNPDKDFLFTCFNKSLQEEVRERFYGEGITNVDVSTFDSIWWKIYHNHIRGGELKPEWSFRHLGELNAYLDGSKDIHEFDSEISKWIKEVIKDETWWTFKRMARDIYDSNGAFVQNMISKYDVLICDEAQDMQPMTFRIVDEKFNKHVHIVYAGDPCQQLYAFTGAIDVMKYVTPDETFTLHKTFRFGNDVCKLLNESGANMYTTFPGVHDKNTPTVRYSQFETHKLRSYIYLFRSVCNMVEQAEKEAKRGRLVSLDFEKRIRDLMREKKQMEFYKRKGSDVYVTNKTQTWLEKLDIGKIRELRDLFSRMKPIDTDDIHIEFSTVHKFKGREGEVVRISDDVIASEDMNIVNVAISRATKLLVLP